MSGPPVVLQLDPHLSGTTWLGLSVHETLADDTDLDLTGADARLAWRDDNGALVPWATWLDDDDQPAVAWTLGAGLEILDPTSGYLYIVGPGVIEQSPGILRGDLKLLLDGAVVVDLRLILPIIAGMTP